MSKKIKVGEYIRFYRGSIVKCTEWDVNYYNDFLKGKIHLCIDNEEEKIMKHSFDIKRLIEEGDYVNGQEVITVYGYDEDGNDKDELGITETDCDFAHGVYLTDLNIKSIVTKEQFKRMEYKL